MFAFIVRRVIYTIPVIIGVSFIVFILFNMVGGDPAAMQLGRHATAEQILELRHQLGLDKPLFFQFVDYLKQVVTFDFGRSWATQERISSIIWDGIGPSLSLTVPSILIGTILAIILGLIVARWRGTRVDKVLVYVSVVGMSFPFLAYILFGQAFLAAKLPEITRAWFGVSIDLFPITGYDDGFGARWYFLALPILIFVVRNLGQDVRFFRTVMLDEVNQDYVRTARAKGLDEKVILLKHVLKNAMIPIITYVVIIFPYLIMGSLLLESFFGIPGLGGLTLNAVNNSDFPVVKAMTTILSLLTIFFTLATDILYTMVDPRVSFK